LAKPGCEQFNAIAAHDERACDIIVKLDHLSGMKARYAIKTHLEFSKHRHKLHLNRFYAI
jgi:hypothetical protein